MGLNIIEKSKGIWSNSAYANLLYYLLVVILGGLISSYMVGAIFCQFVYGISFFSSSELVFDAENVAMINAMKTMQFFNAIGTFVLPPLAFIHLRGKDAVSYFRLKSNLGLKTILVLLLMAWAMIPLANFLGVLNEALPIPEFLNFLKLAEEQTLLLTEQFLQMDTVLDLIAMLVLMGVVAALGEELLFRGVLQNLFKEWSGSKHVAVWITAFLFSVIHLQYHAILPRFALGGFIGYVYLYSGSLRAPILLHFLYNSTLVVLTFFVQQEALNESVEQVGTSDLSLIILSAFVLLLSLVKFLPKVERIG